MFLEKLSETEFQKLVKKIIQEETNAKHIITNNFELPLDEIGRAIGLNEHEYIFAHSPVSIVGKDLKTIEIKGYTIYKDLFSQKYEHEFGKRSYFINDFEVNTTNEYLSHKYVEKNDIEKVFHKFMFEKFGQQYKDAYIKYRKDILKNNNKYYNDETKKIVEEMTK